ncbi:hypothetical protein ACIRNI_15510 [Streptomyces sp. NPDC093546]
MARSRPYALYALYAGNGPPPAPGTAGARVCLLPARGDRECFGQLP